MGCPHCNDLVYIPRAVGENAHRVREVSPAALSSSADSGCTCCRFIFDGIRSVLGPRKLERVEIEQFTSRKDGENRHTYPLVVRAFVGPNDMEEIDFYTDNSRVQEQWPLIPVAPHRSMDSSSQECFAQAKDWLQHCLFKHTECGSIPTPGSAGTTLPSRVIAVGNETQQPALYETKINEKGIYAALSYCWGTTRTFTTTLSTLEARKHGFALTDLPRTCRDAVVAARALGMPFIWIDSLCIVQDSTEDWEREAATMCDVYSNAAVTLAGLNSPDSDAGLFRSFSTRATYYLSCTLGNGETGYVYARKGHRRKLMGFLHADYSPADDDDVGGVLQTRGWTLQELTLSPRILWFSAWELGWSCTTETACECDPIPTSQLMERSSIRLTTRPQDWETPPLEQWRSFVKNFTRRKLTHNTDRLPALTGIATAMSKRINGRYFAGLWEEELEKNLLWTTSWSEVLLDPAALQRWSANYDYAPSWSWACSIGPVWFVHWTNRPRYESVWSIHRITFTPMTSNKYGPGRGEIVIEAMTLPLTVSDDGYFAYPWDGGYIYFSDMEESWFPDYRHPEAECLFLFAGVQGEFRGKDPGRITRFVGLIVEKTTKEAYRRVGLIDGIFNTENCDGSWSDWSGVGTRQEVTLI